MKKQSVFLAAAVAGLFFFVIPAQALPTASAKNWTMLVFINGHNNLDEFGAINISQMEQVGSSANLNIVVQWASLADPITKRILVKKGNQPGKVTSPTVQELKGVDMGSKDELLDFLKWGVQNYPAKHYFVVVWDHGSGWHEFAPVLNPMDISWDDTTNHHITTEELAGVVREVAQVIGHPIDIYGSDACLMAMVEVAQEMAGAVDVFVGSQEVEPGEGWPYDSFLKAWAAKPDAGPAEIGAMLTSAYNDKYKASGSTSTFSTLNMARLPSLLGALQNLKSKVAALPDVTAIGKAAAASQRFFDSDYVDIGDLVQNIAKATPVLAPDLAAVATALKTVVVANGANVAAQGLSIWWPTDASDWKAHSQRYLGLRFDQAVLWHLLLTRFF